MQASVGVLARVSRGRRSPREFWRPTRAGSAAEVVRKRSLSSGLTCRNYSGEENVELVGNPSQQRRRCPRHSIDLATEKSRMSS
jgi:hypothetical protein